MQKVAALALLVVGASHVVQGRAWARFFGLLREKREAGVVANALMHFWPGVFIVSFHDVWTGIPAFLTVYGWLLVIKGAVYLLWPSIGLRSLALVREEHAGKFAYAGVPMVALGLALGWHLLGAAS